MIYTDRFGKRSFVKVLALFLIFICFIIPILSTVFGHYDFYQEDPLNDYQTLPKAHSITKANYKPILNEEKHGLGNITVVNVTVDPSYELGFTGIGGYKTEYDLLADDILLAWLLLP